MHQNEYNATSMKTCNWNVCNMTVIFTFFLFSKHALHLSVVIVVIIIMIIIIICSLLLLYTDFIRWVSLSLLLSSYQYSHCIYWTLFQWKRQVTLWQINYIKLTDTRHSSTWTADWEQSNLINWIKSLVQDSQKVSIANIVWRRPERTVVKTIKTKMRTLVWRNQCVIKLSEVIKFIIPCC